MAKLNLGSKLLKGAQKVGRGTAKVGKIFGRAKSRVGGAVKNALPSKSISKVRGKMSLVPQALQPPEKVTPQARVRNIGKLVDNKVQNLVPKLSKAVQRNVNAFDPQAFLGKIFDGGLNSLQNFASGLGGLQTSLQKSMGFINEAKGIIVDLIEKMAKARPRRARGGIIKGLLKGAAVVGLAALAVKAAPAVAVGAAATGKFALGLSVAKGGVDLAKKVFGRKKRGEEASSEVKGEEINETFKNSLEQFDETLSRIDMQLKGKRYRKEQKEYEEKKKQQEENEDTTEEATENVESDVETETSTDSTNLKTHDLGTPGTNNVNVNDVDLPDPNKQADENVDSDGNPLPIGTVVGGDDMQSSTTVEPLTDPVTTSTGLGGPNLVLHPKSLTVIKGEQGDKGNRGALGSQGDPGRTVSDVQPKGGEQEPPQPQGFARSMAGLGDFLSFGLTDFDKRGDLFGAKDDDTKAGVSTESTGIMPQIIQPLLKQLETRSQVTDSISQPAMAAAIEAAQNRSGSPTVAIPMGGKPQPQVAGDTMTRMDNEVPIVLPVDTRNIHITTSKSLFNIVSAL